MGQVLRRPAARRDLISHYIYLAEEAGDAVAERFLANAEASLAELLDQPRIGAPLTEEDHYMLGIVHYMSGDFDTARTHFANVSPAQRQRAAKLLNDEGFFAG